MKTLQISDRFNPVFVKEIRQSVHDKSLGFAVAVLAVGQLFLWYLWYLRAVLTRNPAALQTTLAAFGLGGTFTILLFLLIHFAMRTGRERNMEGFDPARGTGYPPWKIAMGKAAANWAMTGGLMILFLPGIFVLAGEFLWRQFLIGALFLFAAGQCSQYFYMLTEAKSLGGLWALFFCVQILIAGNILLQLPFAEMHLTTFLQTCGALFLLGITFLCGQITHDLPPHADRSMLFKAAIFVCMIYLLFCAATAPEMWLDWGLNMEMIIGATGGLYLLGALFERRETSRRQIRQAPRHIALRIPAFLFTSGAVPGCITGMLLLAAAQLPGGAGITLADIHGTLICSFYVLLALYIAGSFQKSAVTMWIAALILFNFPCISGVIFPWGAALSLAAPEFLGPETAVAIAATAWLVSLLLNRQLFGRFLRLYLGKQEKG